MLIFKTTLQLIGDQFYSSNMIDKVSSGLLVDFHDPGDKIWPDKEETYDFGMMSVLHPRTFGLQYDEEYHKWYIRLIEENSLIWIKNGVDDIRLFTEVFYNGQCNFEILDKELIHRVNKFVKISLPVSVYELKNKEIEEMLREVGYTKDEIKEKG